jgi:uncharacterized HAD superfamily protein
MNILHLSDLRHTWLIDIDGTILIHNSHLNSENKILPGVINFWNKIPEKDVIILLSARSSEFKETTIAELTKHNIRYDYILFDLPVGERILINDMKPSGLITSIGINTERNKGLENLRIDINESL